MQLANKAKQFYIYGQVPETETHRRRQKWDLPRRRHRLTPCPPPKKGASAHENGWTVRGLPVAPHQRRDQASLLASPVNEE